MNLSLLFHTLRHLRPTQLFHQLWYRIYKPSYKNEHYGLQVTGYGLQVTDPIPRIASWDREKFTFVNLSHEFAGWDFNEFGNLWTYNQNYFDWLNQKGMTAEEGCYWIDKFIHEVLNHKPSTGIGSLSLDPYPIALRGINWIKFFCLHPDCATPPRIDALYSQYRLLERMLEYHLLANHLLEDAFSLYIAASFFQDIKQQQKATKLLLSQLHEQILPDGGHFEQSPMYHCIMLDRLLDCINLGESLEARVKSLESRGEGQESRNKSRELRQYAVRMLGWLKSVCYKNGTYPLFNDSANEIAPTPQEIFDYAKRLGVESEPSPLKESGYRKMGNERMEVFVDVGNVTATYQPGHTHADTFNFELRIDGQPFIVDTGISTYEKNARRQYERSTAAHNTVVVNDKDSSEVWSGFRVGKRANVSIHKEIHDENGYALEVEHDGYGKACKRSFLMAADKLVIEDYYDGEAVSYLHLAEDADESKIKIEGSSHIKKTTDRYSTEYNRFKTSTVLEIHFSKCLTIIITAE